jgi:N-methylhydantoinase A
VSVERGFDPRDFALVAFGGAGPLHAAAIARELHIPTVVVPRLPAHFSALGMLMADLRHDYVRTYYRPLAEADLDAVEAIFAELIDHARPLLASEGVRPAAMRFERYLDVRYVGQEFTIQTPTSVVEVTGADQQAIRQTFDAIHDRRFGHHASEEPVEIVNVRLTARGRRERPRFPPLLVTDRDPCVGHRPVYLDDWRRPVDCPVYDRDRLAPGREVVGPAVIEEYASTTVLFPGDVASPVQSGELIVHIRQGT